MFGCLLVGPWPLSCVDAALHCGEIAEQFPFVPVTAIVCPSVTCVPFPITSSYLLLFGPVLHSAPLHPPITHTHTRTFIIIGGQALQLTQLYNKVDSSASHQRWTHTTSGAEATQWRKILTCTCASYYTFINKQRLIQSELIQSHEDVKIPIGYRSIQLNICPVLQLPPWRGTHRR